LYGSPGLGNANQLNSAVPSFTMASSGFDAYSFSPPSPSGTGGGGGGGGGGGCTTNCPPTVQIPAQTVSINPFLVLGVILLLVAVLILIAARSYAWYSLFIGIAGGVMLAVGAIVG